MLRWQQTLGGVRMLEITQTDENYCLLPSSAPNSPFRLTRELFFNNCTQIGKTIKLKDHFLIIISLAIVIVKTKICIRTGVMEHEYRKCNCIKAQ